MSKIVGLITMHDVINCGSALQCYATQQAVESLGYRCEVIDYRYPDNYYFKHSIDAQNIPAVKKSFLFKIAKRIYLRLFDNKLHGGFRKFKQKHLNLTKAYHSFEELKANTPNSDIYMIGSDQVWNPHYTHFNPTWLLGFVGDDKLKISYAPSFSSSQLLPQYREYFKKHLSRFDVLSVREESGVKIIEELTGKKARHVLDPTLLLNAKQWNEVASPKLINNGKPYILCYLLSYSINPFPYVYDLIERIRVHYNYDVLFITRDDIKEVKRRGYNLVGLTPPDEFLSYFRDAAFVITSSFHGTAFTLNYEKPFYALVNPQIKDDRIESLIEMVGAQHRQIPIGSDLPSPNDFGMSYTEITPRLECERGKSINYLKFALNGEAY